MNETLDIAAAKAQIEILRTQHHRLSGRFLATFTAVPEDKLDWRAAPTAKSAMEIGCHVAAAHRYFLAGLRGDDVPFDFPGAMAWIDERAAQYASRDDIVTCLTDSRGKLDTLYARGINPEAFLTNDDYQFLVRLPAFHTETHAGQIDYLQTCWGDDKMYFQYSEEEGARA